MKFNFETTYLNLPKDFYRENRPEKCLAPELLCFNQSLAEFLELGAFEAEKDLPLLCGEVSNETARPFSQAYAGHQFGYFNKLGDGRAHVLGEHVTPSGQRFDIQLKGSGQTPYSRNGDGRAALAPMLREYLISEAMHHLGIPTTRSLAVIATGDVVYREQPLPGALLVRVASSHIRVGTFQFAATLRDAHQLRQFADYAIDRHAPEWQKHKNRYFEFFRKVVKSQASLIAQWMTVGFVHGVMNTDNMSIAGETIDYGPCAFMNEYDLSTVFSSIDRQGRYAFGRQPEMASWNLTRLAESLLPLFSDQQETAIEMANSALKEFEILFHDEWRRGLKNKLGLIGENDGDTELINEFLEILQAHRADFTNTFCELIHWLKGGCLNIESPLQKHDRFKSWLSQWKKRINEGSDDVVELMQKSNPALIPRNHLVEAALASASENNDFEPFNSLIKALSQPFNHSMVDAKYQQAPGVEFAGYKTFCGT
ncbi:MAG: hypothetical protein RJB66_193 [Pseudomonadota bacterium]|jgi:uncharacterized protein YdiU (UPF0061 family)